MQPSQVASILPSDSATIASRSSFVVSLIKYPILYVSFPAIHILKAQILIHKNNLETSLHP